MTAPKVPKPWANWCDKHGLEFAPNFCTRKTLQHPLLRLDDVVKMLENNICFGDFSKCKCCQRTLKLAAELREVK